MIRVVSSVIIRDGRILLQQRLPRRDYPMAWESPGGKVQLGESDIKALFRELCEEIGWQHPDHAAHKIKQLAVHREVFAPPDVKTAFEISFYKAQPSPDWHPQMLDAAGMGWFTLAETKSLQLAPGNARYFPQLWAKGEWP